MSRVWSAERRRGSFLLVLRRGLVKLPVGYVQAAIGELPGYSALKSSKVWLWVPHGWAPARGAPQEAHWESAGATKQGYAVFRTSLSKPTMIRRRVLEAVRQLPEGLAVAHGRFLLWIGGGYEESAHWGLAFDGRIRRKGGAYSGFGEEALPRKLEDWPVPLGVFPTLVRAPSIKKGE